MIRGPTTLHCDHSPGFFLKNEVLSSNAITAGDPLANVGTSPGFYPNDG